MNNTNLVCEPTVCNFHFHSASPQMEALIELHDIVMFYLVIILFGVAWILVSIIRNFIYKKFFINDEYLNNGTLRDIFRINLKRISILIVSFFFSYTFLCYFPEVEFLSDIAAYDSNENLELSIDNNSLFMDNSQTNHGRPWELGLSSPEVVTVNKPIINLFCTKSTLNNQMAGPLDYFYWSDADENTFNNLSNRTYRPGTMEVDGKVREGVFRHRNKVAEYMKFKANHDRLSQYDGIEFRTGGEPVRFNKGYMLIKLQNPYSV